MYLFDANSLASKSIQFKAWRVTERLKQFINKHQKQSRKEHRECFRYMIVF